MKGDDNSFHSKRTCGVIPIKPDDPKAKMKEKREAARVITDALEGFNIAGRKPTKKAPAKKPRPERPATSNDVGAFEFAEE